MNFFYCICLGDSRITTAVLVEGVSKLERKRTTAVMDHLLCNSPSGEGYRHLYLLGTTLNPFTLEKGGEFPC